MLIELIADRSNRVQCQHRLRGNETDSATKQLAPGAPGFLQQISAVEHHTTVRDLETWWQQAGDDPPDHALSSARLANQAGHLACRNINVNVTQHGDSSAGKRSGERYGLKGEHAHH